MSTGLICEDCGFEVESVSTLGERMICGDCAVSRCRRAASDLRHLLDTWPPLLDRIQALGRELGVDVRQCSCGHLFAPPRQTCRACEHRLVEGGSL